MPKSFINTLSFFRICDKHDRNISLTNLAVIIVLYKLARTPITSLVDTVPLVISMLSYSAKKYFAPTPTSEQENS